MISVIFLIFILKNKQQNHRETDFFFISFFFYVFFWPRINFKIEKDYFNPMLDAAETEMLPGITKDDIRSIFSNVNHLLPISKTLYDSVEQRRKIWNDNQLIADIFLKMVLPSFLPSFLYSLSCSLPSSIPFPRSLSPCSLYLLALSSLLRPFLPACLFNVLSFPFFYRLSVSRLYILIFPSCFLLRCTPFFAVAS